LSQLAAHDQGRAGKIDLMIDVAGPALRIEDNPRSGKLVNQDTAKFVQPLRFHRRNLIMEAESQRQPIAFPWQNTPASIVASRF
jgi:hypothetical protein